MSTLTFPYKRLGGRRPSELLDEEPMRWVFMTDPTLDGLMALDYLLVQVAELYPAPLREEAIQRLNARFGVRNGS